MGDRPKTGLGRMRSFLPSSSLFGGGSSKKSEKESDKGFLSDSKSSKDYNDKSSKRFGISDEHAEIMMSFIPNTLCDEIFHNVRIGAKAEAHSRKFRGIVMIVDISGFTKLSGAFCAKGKDGIDGLQKIVNGFMGLLVREVYKYGGDVVKFAGDALICIFEPDATMPGSMSLLRPCMKSALCAWKLKEESYASELTVHIGIALGDICFGVVGGHMGRWEFLISGSCISELSECLNDAPSKHVAVTKTFYDTLSNLLVQGQESKFETDGFAISGDIMPSTNVKITNIDGVPLSGRDPSLEFAASAATPVGSGGDNLLGKSLPVTTIRECQKIPYDLDTTEDRIVFSSQIMPYVPLPVTEALHTDSFDFIAELREVTTVFINWENFSSSEHQDVLALQRPFFAAQEIINHAGGFLRQFLVDDKGCVLIAMWGVPAAAFPDNCIRALWATVTMCQKLKQFHMPLSCGMTTGTVYCGTVGSSLRQEYAAIGDVVNLSARLMSKADKSILIDENTFVRLPEQIQLYLEGLPEIKVKGKDAPIKPFKYRDMEQTFDFKDINYSLETFPIRQGCIDVFTPALQYLNTMKESQPTGFNLSTYIDAHLHGKPKVAPQFILIEGPAGTGRGRSLSWLKHNADVIPGVKSIMVTLGKMDGATDYSFLARVFRQYIGEDNFDDPDRQEVEVSALLNFLYPMDREGRERVAYPAMVQALGVTSRLRNAKPIPPRPIPPRQLRPSIHDVFVKILNRQTTLIMVENAQYVDGQSWEIIHDFVELELRAVFVFASLPMSVGVHNSISSKLLLSEDSGLAAGSKVVERNFTRLIQYKSCHHVILSQYTFSEMKVYLAHSLKVRVNALPKGLDALVFQLSGGNPMWVSEICEFIRSHSVNEFMRAMTGHDPDSSGEEPSMSSRQITTARRPSSASVSQSLRSITKQLTFHFDLSFVNSSSSRSASTRDDDFGPSVADSSRLVTGRSSSVAASAAPQALHTINEAEQVDDIGGDNHHTHADGVAGNKLSFLIVCRFAKMRNESQTACRSASIIGQEFTEDVLRSVTPPKLHKKLPGILKGLVRSNWVTQTEEKTRKGVPYTVFAFSHPLVYSSIYDLTPKGVRQAVHLNIATYLAANESTLCDRQGFYENLAFHYGKCDGQSAQEFYALAKASLEYVHGAFVDLEKATMFVETMIDKGQNSNDMASLIGILCKIKERHKQEESTEQVEKMRKKSRMPVMIQRQWSFLSSLIPKRQRIQPGIDLSDDIAETIKSLESQIELKESEFLAAEVNQELPQVEEWQRGLIYLRKKKSMLHQSISRRIGFSIKKGIASFSRKAPASRRSNSSNLEDVLDRSRESSSESPSAPPATRSARYLFISWFAWFVCRCGCFGFGGVRRVVAGYNDNARQALEDNSISNRSSARARVNIVNFSSNLQEGVQDDDGPSLGRQQSNESWSSHSNGVQNGSLLNYLSPQRLFVHRQHRYVD